MKRIFLLFILSFPVLVSGQVVNFAKTLPQRAFSLGATAAWHVDNAVLLFDAEGPSFSLSGGYGLIYAMDVNARYVYYMNGPDYIGVDLQYLLHESRYSYFSAMGGVHRWDNYGLDLTGLYTYSPRYYLNLSVGLDMDISFASVVRPRFWVPLNAGFNVTEMIFLFVEYNLPVSQYSWDIFALGANFIFR